MTPFSTTLFSEKHFQVYKLLADNSFAIKLLVAPFQGAKREGFLYLGLEPCGLFTPGYGKFGPPGRAPRWGAEYQAYMTDNRTN